ncbi:MAG: SRPBCC domain-containing protein [Sphingobium sp.]|nr:SRPBCC domain-containing protein [Sphingobium sp.]
MTAEADDLSLSVTIYIEAAPAHVWQVMTERQEEWWCPRPWRVEIVEQDWRAGGRASMTMHGPDGETMPNEGVFLEVTPGVRYVVTDAFHAGWKPAGPFMVGIWAIEPEGSGTRFTGSARHWTKEARDQHKAMGFEAGWGVVAQQLKELCEA